MHLPAPEASCVHMNEIGIGVISDAPAMQGQRGVSKPGCGHTRDANIDGLRLHVRAVPGYGVSVTAQILVAPGRPVAANHVDLGAGTSQGYGEIVEQVEHPWIVLVDRTRPAVAQKLIHTQQRVRIVDVAMTVHDFEASPGVCIK